MKDYDFEGEFGRALSEDCGDPEMASAVQDWPACLAALRRAYAAGVQASGGGSDLAHLVTLAAVALPWALDSFAGNAEDQPQYEDAVAEIAAKVLSALKAQAVKP